MGLASAKATIPIGNQADGFVCVPSIANRPQLCYLILRLGVLPVCLQSIGKLATDLAVSYTKANREGFDEISETGSRRGLLRGSHAGGRQRLTLDRSGKKRRCQGRACIARAARSCG